MPNNDNPLMTVSLERANETQLDIMSTAMVLASENAKAICKDAGYPDNAAEPAERLLKEIAGNLIAARDMLRGMPKGNYGTIANHIDCRKLTGGGSLEDSRES